MSKGTSIHMDDKLWRALQEIREELQLLNVSPPDFGSFFDYVEEEYKLEDIFDDEAIVEAARKLSEHTNIFLDEIAVTLSGEEETSVSESDLADVFADHADKVIELLRSTVKGEDAILRALLEQIKRPSNGACEFVDEHIVDISALLSSMGYEVFDETGLSVRHRKNEIHDDESEPDDMPLEVETLDDLYADELDSKRQEEGGGKVDDKEKETIDLLDELGFY